MGAPDATIAALAARQHGVVSRAQLLAAGVSSEAIKHRLGKGSLVRLHAGVYRFTRGKRESRRGIRVHRAPVRLIRVEGIPTTTVARTLLDIAAELPQRDLLRAVEEAQVRRKLTPAALADAVSRAGGHRGAAALRAAARALREPRLTRSEAERLLLELVRRAQLPEPRTNVRILGWEVDAYWPAERLVVEMDSFAFHSSRQAFERDRRKDADLIAAGHRVIRITWRRLIDEPEAVVAQLAGALSARP